MGIIVACTLFKLFKMSTLPSQTTYGLLNLVRFRVDPFSTDALRLATDRLGSAGYRRSLGLLMESLLRVLLLITTRCL